jgi:hypothetical protein
MAWDYAIHLPHLVLTHLTGNNVNTIANLSETPIVPAGGQVSRRVVVWDMQRLPTNVFARMRISNRTLIW